jgi:tetratricopeptide (TPR) repeat protein
MCEKAVTNMSLNTTYPSKGRMDCDRVGREDIVESYLAQTLSEADREAFEEHYFECARCFDALATLQTLQAELQRTRAELEPSTTSLSFAWGRFAAVAAAVVLSAGLLVWMRAKPPAVVSEQTDVHLSPGAKSPETPRSEGTPASPAPLIALEQLARVDPPRYEPLTFRGAPDEAAARFERGMQQYRKAEYRGAVTDLGAAAALDPDAPHSRFFLGISHLMLGDDTAAIDSLRATVALGDSAYLEEAHWYLAKAFLRRKDIRTAETHLQALIELRGSESDKARQLLTELDRLKARSQ